MFVFGVNKKVINFFENALQNSNLAHAYCFLGANYLGKEATARNLAAKLLNTEVEKLEINPDFCKVERNFDDKSGKLKKEIGVSQIRELRQRLANFSWSNGYKVIIIREAELLSEEASNAFLKILEEPNSKTLYFLIAQSEDSLLPTIKSRCQIFNFNAWPEEEIRNFLQTNGAAKEKLERMCVLSAGRIRLAQLLLDEDFYRDYSQKWEDWENLYNSSVSERLKWIDKSLNAKKEEGGLPELLSELEIWTMAARANLILNANVGKEGGTTKVMKELADLKTNLLQNVNPRLALEKLALNI